MENKKVQTLRIDKGIKNIIRPLFKQEYLQLEANILADGCRDPITTWNGIIVDGHNRYEICTKHQIPFSVEEMEFDCREEAIAWICANQLGRRNLTEETRKYLIGLQYESEKTANQKKNEQGKNQHSTPGEDSDKPTIDAKERNKTANRIAEQNRISHTTVEKYGAYSRAIDIIEQKEPKMAEKILSGAVKVSYENVARLSSLPQEKITEVNKSIEKREHEKTLFPKSLRDTDGNKVNLNKNILGQTIKDMPVFDPDAEITGLTLTIPSWASSIDRVRTKTNLDISSIRAKKRLLQALTKLQKSIGEMMTALGDEGNE